MNHYLLASSYFLHLLATVVWLGGMALQVLILFPLREAEWQPLLDRISARLRPMSNFSLLVLLMTGVVQTSEDEHYGGLLSFENDWSRAILAKHIAFTGMVFIVLFLQFGLAPALERTKLLAKKDKTKDNEVDVLRGRERRLTQVNFLLSILVLLFTAIATAL